MQSATQSRSHQVYFVGSKDETAGNVLCQLSRIADGRYGCRSGCHRPSRTEVEDRKSTRLNSSHQIISYAVFCFQKNKYTIHLHRSLETTTLPSIPLCH